MFAENLLQVMDIGSWCALIGASKTYETLKAGRGLVKINIRGEMRKVMRGDKSPTPQDMSVIVIQTCNAAPLIHDVSES